MGIDGKSIINKASNGVECVSMDYVFGEGERKYEATFLKVGSGKWQVCLLAPDAEDGELRPSYAATFEVRGEKPTLEQVVADGLNTIKVRIVEEIARKSAIEFAIADELRGM